MINTGPFSSLLECLSRTLSSSGWFRSSVFVPRTPALGSLERELSGFSQFNRLWRARRLVKNAHRPALGASFNIHFNCHFSTVNDTRVMMCNELPVNIYNALAGCCHMVQPAVDLITSNKFDFPPLAHAASECF